MFNIQGTLEDRVLGFIENQISNTENIEDKKELLKLYVEAFKSIVEFNKDTTVLSNKIGVEYHKINADFNNKTQENYNHLMAMQNKSLL
ncbi:hypothetical protein [Campylobacter majalis]|uniref:hypothetical protein n=1 Tax=Campylobacter majalis TaxID=2790656 RepID=UPI003D69E3BA